MVKLTDAQVRHSGGKRLPPYGLSGDTDVVVSGSDYTKVPYLISIEIFEENGNQTLVCMDKATAKNLVSILIDLL